jgi:hypothetical protein
LIDQSLLFIAFVKNKEKNLTENKKKKKKKTKTTQNKHKHKQQTKRISWSQVAFSKRVISTREAALNELRGIRSGFFDVTNSSDLESVSARLFCLAQILTESNSSEIGNDLVKFKDWLHKTDSPFTKCPSELLQVRHFVVFSFPFLFFFRFLFLFLSISTCMYKIYMVY